MAISTELSNGAEVEGRTFGVQGTTTQERCRGPIRARYRVDLRTGGQVDAGISHITYVQGHVADKFPLYRQVPLPTVRHHAAGVLREAWGNGWISQCRRRCDRAHVRSVNYERCVEGTLFINAHRFPLGELSETRSDGRLSVSPWIIGDTGTRGAVVIVVVDKRAVGPWGPRGKRQRDAQRCSLRFSGTARI